MIWQGKKVFYRRSASSLQKLARANQTDGGDGSLQTITQHTSTMPAHDLPLNTQKIVWDKLYSMVFLQGHWGWNPGPPES